MFGYKRFGSFRGKRYYSYGGPYRYRRWGGTVSRSLAGAAAAKRSDKTETYSCTVNGVAITTLPNGDNLSRVFLFHPYNGGLNGQAVVADQNNLVLGGAVNDRGFRMKCACYDEVKLDSMKVTLTPGLLNPQNFATLTLCTMWDRKASPKECGYVGQADWMANGSVPYPTEIYNNEGAIKSQFSSNNIYGTRRYCRASTIIEKGGFHDSSILYNSTPNQSPLVYFYMDAWLRGPLAFSPSLNCCVYSPVTFQADQQLNFVYKVEYCFTFRNPKSDLDYFLTVEAPGYVNPEADAGDVVDPNRDVLQRGMREVYTLKRAGVLGLKDASKMLSSVYKEKEKDMGDEAEEVEEVEMDVDGAAEVKKDVEDSSDDKVEGF